jgi:sigma-B regulation protein RsbU (phosphoserine phosphatase)
MRDWHGEQDLRVFEVCVQQTVSSSKLSYETQNPRSVLVVDDSRLQRRILSSMLNRWGFEVIEASTGAEALEMCRKSRPEFIFSDWMMPELNGPDFCRAFRKLCPNDYSDFTLLTSKSEKNDIAKGLDSGADDFLTKPVNAPELRARITAGERILSMQSELQRQNALIQDTLDELKGLYATINSDLLEAQKLQQSLIREHERQIGPFHITQFVRSLGHVSGDLVGFFEAGPSHLGVFGVDVSGHGISSALFTARVAGYFSSGSVEQNLALETCADGIPCPRAPEDVMADLNHQVLHDIETDLYFTMVLADLNLETGLLRFAQAGHPHPVLQSNKNTFLHLGTGGMPVGLIDDITFERTEYLMRPGDRLFIVSDGVTECPDPSGALLDQEDFEQMLRQFVHKHGQDVINDIFIGLAADANLTVFPDDVSIIMVEHRGAVQN